MKAAAVLLVGCALGSVSSFKLGGGRLNGGSIGAPRARASTTATRMMAVDPVTLHSVGEYVNAIAPLDLDHTWVSHVMHGLSDAAVATGSVVEEEVKKPGPFGVWINFIKQSVLSINTFYKSKREDLPKNEHTYIHMHV
ncbi:unnamed protein product [Choristocarpus tenellus]